MPDCRQDLLLRSRVGAGATAAVINLVDQVVKTNESIQARVLVVLAPSLIGQFRELLSEAGHRAMILDRKRLRVMQAEDEPSLFENPTRETIFLVGRNSLMHPEFAKALGTMAWNLLVVDEINAVRESVAVGIECLLKASQRRLFIDRGGLGFGAFRSDSEPTVVDWNDREIFGDQKPTIRFARVEYAETKEEADLSAAVERLVSVLPPLPDEGQSREVISARRGTGRSIASTNPLKMALMRNLKSSQAAVEQSVRRLMGQVEKGDAPRLGEVDGQDEPAQVAQADAFHDDIVKPVLAHCRTVLDCIDAITLDSKLQAFLTRLRQISQHASTNVGIFVITNSQSTSYYIATEAESMGIPARVLGRETSGYDLLTTVTAFRVGGGLLVADVAALKGLELDCVDHLIFFDVPTDNFHFLSMILGRFLGFRRSREIHVHVLGNPQDWHGDNPLWDLFNRVIAEISSPHHRR